MGTYLFANGSIPLIKCSVGMIDLVIDILAAPLPKKINGIPVQILVIGIIFNNISVDGPNLL